MLLACINLLILGCSIEDTEVSGAQNTHKIASSDTLLIYRDINKKNNPALLGVLYCWNEEAGDKICTNKKPYFSYTEPLLVKNSPYTKPLDYEKVFGNDRLLIYKPELAKITIKDSLFKLSGLAQDTVIKYQDNMIYAEGDTLYQDTVYLKFDPQNYMEFYRTHPPLL